MLRPGDRLLEPDQSHVTVISSVREEHPDGLTVYNFEVAGLHDYFVSATATDSLVLSHNMCRKTGSGAVESEGPFVYRGLARGEDPTVGLTARAPGAGNSEISHVAGKRQSQWISTTKDEATAIGKYGEHGVVRIDLSKVPSNVSDVSGGFDNGGRMSNLAKRDREVLIQGSVPAEAITRIN
ncbi:MAG TPA: hypothetical protein DDZ51_02150 [Planctomycetaceae bacterium]|nr:hypothetical protein [Planctomycetaceae bacterium]